MKKLWICILALLLLAASAQAGNTITALATDINAEHPASTAVHVRITAYNADDHTLSVELIVPEAFNGDEVESLQPGDAIFSGGQEILIRSIEEEGSIVGFNEDDTFRLVEQEDSSYFAMSYSDHVWITAAKLRLPVTDRLIFLDDIDPENGVERFLPAVYSGSEFLNILAEETKVEGVGFDINNVMAVFDEKGGLALIRRFYVPWQ